MFVRLRSRCTRWIAVRAMLFVFALQVAAPWLAQAAAQAQGKTLVEVCSVYGVRMVALDDGGNPPPAPDVHAPDCALLALPVLAAGPQDSTAEHLLPRIGQDAEPTVAPAPLRGLDPHARWQARRKQGPPTV